MAPPDAKALALAPLLEHWYRAMASPLGIVLRVSDMKRALARLYKARAEGGDPALKGLQLRRSPLAPQDEIWICPAGQVDLTAGTEAEAEDLGASEAEDP